ncbi:MAG: hypothetical protein IJO48_02225 [Clostridia bacterium]|nr:hypothetical protein [Clostridia bacterium]
MDIKAEIEKIVTSITKDNSIMENFKKDPVATVKGLLGSVDLDNEAINKIVDGVKAKISVDKISDALGGLKKLF